MIDYKTACSEIVRHYGSISEAARQIGISYTAYYSLLNGSTTDPQYSTHVKVMSALKKIRKKGRNKSD